MTRCWLLSVILYNFYCLELVRVTPDSDRHRDFWAHYSSSSWSRASKRMTPAQLALSAAGSRSVQPNKSLCCLRLLLPPPSSTPCSINTHPRCHEYTANAGIPPSIFSSWYLWILHCCELDRCLSGSRSLSFMHSSSSVYSGSNNYGSVWWSSSSSSKSLSLWASATIACVVMLKDVQTCKFTQELLSLFTPAKTGEQLHIDLKRLPVWQTRSIFVSKW